MKKFIEVTCSPEIKDMICAALKLYIDATFPQGSSDCGLVAREELLIALKDFETSYNETGIGKYNKRIRAFVAEAIKLYFEHDYMSHPDKDRLCALVVQLSKGETLSNEEQQTLVEKINSV